LSDKFVDSLPVIVFCTKHETVNRAINFVRVAKGREEHAFYTIDIMQLINYDFESFA